MTVKKISERNIEYVLSAKEKKQIREGRMGNVRRGCKFRRVAQEDLMITSCRAGSCAWFHNNASWRLL